MQFAQSDHPSLSWTGNRVPTARAVGLGGLAGALAVFAVRAAHAIDDHGWSRLLQPTLWLTIAPYAGLGAVLTGAAAPWIESFHGRKALPFYMIRIFALGIIVGLAAVLEMLFGTIGCFFNGPMKTFSERVEVRVKNSYLLRLLIFGFLDGRTGMEAERLRRGLIRRAPYLLLGLYLMSIGRSEDSGERIPSWIVSILGSFAILEFLLLLYRVRPQKPGVQPG